MYIGAMSSKNERRVYDLCGTVQGVGFRPTLARLAKASGLGGSVQNRTDSVRLIIEGEADAIELFMAELANSLPSNARIESLILVSSFEIDPKETDKNFTVAESFAAKGDSRVSIPADLGVCPDCAREVLDVLDRRYGYPFTTCTACGPRYTVVNAMPYDRERTTLASFELCEKCRREYEDSADRRLHAESIACPACGPRAWLETATGDRIAQGVFRHARRALHDGAILAVRGMGGYLLAADPFNPAALVTLRERKKRPDKPFAVMARNMESLARHVELNTAARGLLESPIAPIIIADRKPESDLPFDLLNPDNDTLGVMLPNTPLHMLLFEPVGSDTLPPFELLVMTSGNRGGEPICIGNEEARERLAGIADLMLCHNREINLRNDDSIFAIRASVPQVWRRARGCSPQPIKLKWQLPRPVLAMGAGLKNTIALGAGDSVVVSPHIGDLDTPEALDALEKVLLDMPAFLRIDPEVVAVDLHPDLPSSVLGRRIAKERGIELVEVQHHHAHAAACLAEHGLNEGLALAMDGTGMGADGKIWGAELMRIDSGGFERLGSFCPAPLPGGDAATLSPTRQLVGRLHHLELELGDELLSTLGIGNEESATWRTQIETGLNCPWTTAAGRLFDSFAALLGLVAGRITYDAQAAIRLEAAALRARSENLPQLHFELTEHDGIPAIDWAPCFRLVDRIEELRARPEDYALAFHHAFVDAAIHLAKLAIERDGHRVIALSGGVFMNGIVSELMVRRFGEIGMQALLHRRIPPNDGGISFGQATVAL